MCTVTAALYGGEHGSALCSSSLPARDRDAGSGSDGGDPDFDPGEFENMTIGSDDDDMDVGYNSDGGHTNKLLDH